MNLQYNSGNFVILLVVTNSYITRNTPGDIRQVNKTVDADLKTDKDTEISNRLDRTGNRVTLVVLFGKFLPWVWLALFQT